MITNHLQRLQANWDWRAAANFVCGGMGSALVAFTTLNAMDAPAARVLIALGLALVGIGLFCVWLEIGRPWRAANVFLHLRTSWMSREAVAALALYALGTGLLAGMDGRAWPAAVAALAFLYCQVRMLAAGRGIPAWREPATAWLVFATGLAEGAGVFWLFSASSFTARSPALLFGALIVARWLAWEIWHLHMAMRAGPGAVAWSRRMQPWARWVASGVPLALVAIAMAGAADASWLLGIAGLLVTATGAAFKFVLVTRMSFQQGFSLPRMPVRGVPRARTP